MMDKEINDVTKSWVAHKIKKVGSYTYHRGRTEYTAYAGISGTTKTAHRALVDKNGKVVFETWAEYRDGEAESYGYGITVSAYDEEKEVDEYWQPGSFSVSELDVVIRAAVKHGIELEVEDKRAS